ncbi:MAG: CIA30 family protein [Crocinitomicaceae bacterium]
MKLTLSVPTDTLNLVDFTSADHLNNWRVVDDVIMGGESKSNFKVNKNQYAYFSGKISLENDGGFCSVHTELDAMNIAGKNQLLLHVKGDGNRYMLRIKSVAASSFSYVHYFQTSGDWETIHLDLHHFHPRYRGENLDLPNYKGEQIEEIGFLFSSKKAQEFNLLIKKIELV